MKIKRTTKITRWKHGKKGEYTRVADSYENYAESFKRRITSMKFRNCSEERSDDGAFQFEIQIMTESHKGNFRTTLGSVNLSMADFEALLRDQGIEFNRIQQG